MSGRNNVRNGGNGGSNGDNMGSGGNGVNNPNNQTQTQQPNNQSVEASAICNYATFIYRQKKDLTTSLNMFESGLKKFGGHKGLVKNYLHLLKSNPTLQGDPSLLVLLQRKLKKKASFRDG